MDEVILLLCFFWFLFFDGMSFRRTLSVGEKVYGITVIFIKEIPLNF
jgi:hypothetical protein